MISLLNFVRTLQSVMSIKRTPWTPVDNQKINQTQKSVYKLHLKQR